MVINIGGPPEGFERERSIEEEPQICPFCNEEITERNPWIHFRKKEHDLACRNFIDRLKDGIRKRLRVIDLNNLKEEEIVRLVLEELQNSINHDPLTYLFLLNNFDKEFLLKNFLVIELIHTEVEEGYEEVHYIYLYFDYRIDETGFNIFLIAEDSKGRKSEYSVDIKKTQSILTYYCRDCTGWMRYNFSNRQLEHLQVKKSQKEQEIEKIFKEKYEILQGDLNNLEKEIEEEIKNQINQNKEDNKILVRKFLDEIFSIITKILMNDSRLYFLLYTRLREIKLKFNEFFGDSLRLAGCPLCDVYSIYIDGKTPVTFEFIEEEELFPRFKQLTKCPRCNTDLVYF
ncbi:hypothetical protein HRbin35_00111 [bacterium HR35]|nr:hypothetical protein HRbin35_00111 [bacterium HR35]